MIQIHEITPFPPLPPHHPGSPPSQVAFKPSRSGLGPGCWRSLGELSIYHSIGPIEPTPQAIGNTIANNKKTGVLKNYIFD